MIPSLKQKISPILDKLSSIKGLPNMFEQCFFSTIQTTYKQIEGETFIITGDIPAMWLRDSSCQIMHYLRYADDEKIKAFIASVIKTQFDFINYDIYANAFNMEEGKSWDPKDLPPKLPRVWERKYETDSLCFPVMLIREYYNKTKDTAVLSEEVHIALKAIVDLFALEQRHENSSYYFIRENCPETDTLKNNGRGTDVAYTGMTWAGFRPSDDACEYHYNVPGNLFVSRALADIAFFAEIIGDEALKKSAIDVKNEIDEGISRFALLNDENGNKYFAYELDGLGHSLFMDDANVPSLLSLPYLGALEAENPIYQNTRKRVLSKHNRYYFEGKKASGVGSPHTPENYVWHISLAIQAMTSLEDEEKARILDTLISSTAGTGFMHEGFDKDEPANFTRSWFAWANSLFAELVLRLYDENKLEKILSLMKNKEVK